MFNFFSLLICLGAAIVANGQGCPDYLDYSKGYHPPFSAGRYNLSYQRPSEACRTFTSQAVEDTITRLNSTIADPDLFRLFQNSYPNTLDTAIKWKGYAAGTDEDLTFVITGDMYPQGQDRFPAIRLLTLPDRNAMWLRDSANQMQSYLPLLQSSTSNNSIASLYRGVINLQSRYLLTSPYCNSFQPPVESGIAPAENSAARNDKVVPAYDNQSVFECKYELDSLAAFLEVSTNYYTGTQDVGFFGKYHWVDAIKAVMNVAEAMMTPTYAPDGRVNTSPYTFTRLTTRASETLENNGLGNPVQANTGLIRSAFRPSDDATIFQLFIPANMMFAHYLNTTAQMVSSLGTQPALAQDMSRLSAQLRDAISTHGIVNDPVHGMLYAYEVDGYGSRNLMDDANIPSLLSAPFFAYLDAHDPVYQSTRAFILSADDPYFMRGPVINAVGGPHNGPGYAWPMASIIRILTSDDDAEITTTLREIVSSTAGLGLIHESINSFDQSDWTRQWFSWANGLFGQMILDLERRKPGILKQSFQ